MDQKNPVLKIRLIDLSNQKILEKSTQLIEIIDGDITARNWMAKWSIPEVQFRSIIRLIESIIYSVMSANLVDYDSVIPINQSYWHSIFFY